MKKRLKFQCWNCQRPYSLLRDIEEGNPQLSIACPFCGAAAIADLTPYRKPIDTIYRGASSANFASDESSFDLPDILPTQAEA